MTTVKTIFFSLLLFCFTISARAWGLTGHRVVGEVAESWLTPKAKAAIKAILGNESLAMASNWADFIRSDSTFNYLSSWHYINLTAGLSRSDVLTRLQKDTGVNVYTRVNFIVNELKKNKKLTLAEKKLYLRLLIHFIGDIHQPLHVGHPDDAGGNRVRVQWFGEATNLHTVWDERLPDFQKLSYTEWARAINHASSTQRLAWQKQPIAEWIWESYEIAGDVYAGITQPDQRLSYRYNFDYIGVINQQLLKGGIRLAGILNHIFS
jgi:hypothetical protein